MKLLFSEAGPDYARYMFPYAIWAFPETGERASDMFAAGFLPSSPALDRFYMCRHLRVDLSRFLASSENRRILKKGAGISGALTARKDFKLTAERRRSFRDYADIKFGKDVMDDERLDRLFHSKLVSHVLLFTDEETGGECGAATLWIEPPVMAYYYYAFYDLNYYRRNLGMYMMTFAVRLFAESGLNYAYLGSCYTANSLYKAQFRGAEFFNGFRWSTDRKELKFLIERGRKPVEEHLLENETFLKAHCPEGVKALSRKSSFQARL